MLDTYKTYPSVYAVLSGPGNRTESSARLTWREVTSASVYMATLFTPAAAQALIHRTAISPRLAIRTFLIWLRAWDTIVTVDMARKSFAHHKNLKHLSHSRCIIE